VVHIRSGIVAAAEGTVNLNSNERVLRSVRLAAVLAGVLLSEAPSVSAQSGAAPRCTPGPVARVAALPEGSGVAVSRDGTRVWAHNDSGEGGLIALDERGRVTGRVPLGVKVEDWEALAAGPCPAGSCLFIGDIGDNEGERKEITVYRVPEPTASGAIRTAEVFRLTYPDEPQDAETLLVTPKGDLYIVTKGETAPVALYRVPRTAKPGTTAVLERVGKPRASAKASADDRISDGAVSPDGAWVVLRTRNALAFHAAGDLLAGNWRERGRVSLAALNEPQGEGVAFANATTLYVVGEGGGKKQPGTIARLTCAL
jgi:hypothetical protein